MARLLISVFFCLLARIHLLGRQCKVDCLVSELCPYFVLFGHKVLRLFLELLLVHFFVVNVEPLSHLCNRSLVPLLLRLPQRLRHLLYNWLDRHLVNMLRLVRSHVLNVLFD